MWRDVSGTVGGGRSNGSNGSRTVVSSDISGVLDVLHNQVQTGGVVHAVLMFDKLATEKIICWDPKSNLFLGVCQQHAHKASTEFVNEEDMEELFRNLDDGMVHYAAEVRMF